MQEAIRLNDQEVKNYRTTQPLNGRPVFYFDASKCKQPRIAQPEIQPVGHYEKIPKKSTQYFYVNGQAPSGLPGSFVVSEADAKGTDDPKLQAFLKQRESPGIILK